AEPRGDAGVARAVRERPGPPGRGRPRLAAGLLPEGQAGRAGPARPQDHRAGHSRLSLDRPDPGCRAAADAGAETSSLPRRARFRAGRRAALRIEPDPRAPRSPDRLACRTGPWTPDLVRLDQPHRARRRT